MTLLWDYANQFTNSNMPLRYTALSNCTALPTKRLILLSIRYCTATLQIVHYAILGTSILRHSIHEQTNSRTSKPLPRPTILPMQQSPITLMDDDDDDGNDCVGWWKEEEGGNYGRCWRSGVRVLQFYPSHAASIDLSLLNSNIPDFSHSNNQHDINLLPSLCPHLSHTFVKPRTTTSLIS